MAETKGVSSIPEPPTTINGEYTVGVEIGKGAFGRIFHGKHAHTGTNVAIKLEDAAAKRAMLKHEARIYRQITGTGIPKFYWYGTEGAWNAMVIEYLGPSIEGVFQSFQRAFSLKNVLLLGKQMLNRIEYFHENDLIHRDVKPENFVLGRGAESSTLYIVDFGLVSRYRDINGQHIPYREGKLMTGTPRYASVYTHLGIEQARRDDLEGIGYILVYLLKGSLPWQGFLDRSKSNNYAKILHKKLNCANDQLCAGLPSCFEEYLNYCGSLEFEDRPDYRFLKNLLEKELEIQGFSMGSPSSSSLNFEESHGVEGKEEVKNTKSPMMKKRNAYSPPTKRKRYRVSSAAAVLAQYEGSHYHHPQEQP